MNNLALKLRTEPEVALAYDRIAEQYDIAYLRRKDIAENRYVVRQLRDGGFLHGRVLDAGCGTGFLLDEHRLDPRQYIGVDISPGMLSIAQRKHPQQAFILGDMSELPEMQLGSFDSVVSLFGSANYCLNLRQVFSASRRVLHPGGKIFFMLGSPRWAHRGVYCLSGSSDTRLFYTPVQVRGLLQEHFSHVTVRGMSLLIDYLPEFLPQELCDRWLRLECMTAGHLFPGACFYLLASGIKAEGDDGPEVTQL